MEWLASVQWNTGEWITPAIHIYAGVVFVLTFSVFVVHRSRLFDLARRLSNIAGRIEGKQARPTKLRLDEMTAAILQLGDIVERRADLEIAPVVDFLRQEERQRGIGGASALVNLTETMIELFPMLGIFGTVWAISGVSGEDFSSGRLLILFGTAISTTLWALLYVIVFRIGYSAFVQGKVVALQEYSMRFHDFLSILERRSRRADLSVAAPRDSWSESG